MERDAKDARANDPQRDATASLRVSYTPREGATPEGEIAALAAVYRYCLFQRHETKSAGGDGGKEAAEQSRTVETVPEKRKS